MYTGSPSLSQLVVRVCSGDVVREVVFTGVDGYRLFRFVSREDEVVSVTYARVCGGSGDPDSGGGVCSDQ